MKIIVKNVGQGDSIIVEWIESGRTKIGIIDCHKPNEFENPLLSHLKSLFIKPVSIEFIILSHPHTDHFSGMLELLNFCISKKLNIKYFFHTCSSVKDYVKSAVRSTTYSTLLMNIFRLVNSMYKNGQIGDYAFVNNMTKLIDLGDGYGLQFLSPSANQYNAYNKIAFKDNKDGKINNPNANLLSTIIKISKAEKYVLLTADSVKARFKELRRKSYFSELGLLVGTQVPHHGSIENFDLEFWKTLYIKELSPLAAVSAGNGYGHPSEKVVNDLQAIGYNVKITKKLHRKTDSKMTMAFGMDILDLISTAIEEKIDDGDDIEIALD
jgi:beta-lactamase superfamily II metal-dependent hydrolase